MRTNASALRLTLALVTACTTTALATRASAQVFSEDWETGSGKWYAIDANPIVLQSDTGGVCSSNYQHETILYSAGRAFTTASFPVTGKRHVLHHVLGAWRHGHQTVRGHPSLRCGRHARRRALADRLLWVRRRLRRHGHGSDLGRRVALVQQGVQGRGLGNVPRRRGRAVGRRRGWKRRLRRHPGLRRRVSDRPAWRTTPDLQRRDADLRRQRVRAVPRRWGLRRRYTTLQQHDACLRRLSRGGRLFGYDPRLLGWHLREVRQRRRLWRQHAGLSGERRVRTVLGDEQGQVRRRDRGLRRAERLVRRLRGEYRLRRQHADL